MKLRHQIKRKRSAHYPGPCEECGQCIVSSVSFECTRPPETGTNGCRVLSYHRPPVNGLTWHCRQYALLPGIHPAIHTCSLPTSQPEAVLCVALQLPSTFPFSVVGFGLHSLNMAMLRKFGRMERMQSTAPCYIALSSIILKRSICTIHPC